MCCKHVWTVKVEKTIPALLESMQNVDGEVPRTVFDRTHICIMVCEKCGKVYKSVEKV